jgi:hypothetical protein
VIITAAIVCLFIVQSSPFTSNALASIPIQDTYGNSLIRIYALNLKAHFAAGARFRLAAWGAP